VAPDESYIVISAKEHPDYECEIYISYHKKNGTWTNPKSLGPEINNGPAHRWGEYVTPDNKYLFYSYGHGPGDCAIYWVQFDKLLENLKYTNYEPYVKDSINNQEVSVGQSYAFTIPSNTFFDDDGDSTLVYSAALADGNALPAWLHFDAKEKKFRGITNERGIYKIEVIGTDTSNAKAECVFSIRVN
jgi:Putative Ig domain